MRTYGELRSEERRWLIYKPEPHVVIKMKAVFESIRKSQSQFFYFDNTPENCVDLEWFTQRYPMKMSEQDRELLLSGKKAFLHTQAEMEKILLPDYVPRDIEMVGKLRHYQSVAHDLALARKILLLGDPVGMGKTPVSVGLMSTVRHKPHIVVVQTHLPKQWMKEIYKFLPLANVHYVTKRKPYSLPDADIYIFKYGCIGGWVDVLHEMDFGVCTFDEVQELRHDGTDKHEGCRVAALRSEYKLALSATPIYNKGAEIYNILKAMNCYVLGEWSEFYREWCYNGGYVHNPKALGTYLRDNHVFLRRTREEVGRELPPTNKIPFTVEHDEAEVKSAEELAKTLAIKSTSGSFTERGQATRDLDVLVRKMTGIAKAKSVAEFVKMIASSGEKILLAGWHRRVYEIWNEELKEFNPVMYTGSEVGTQKDKSKEAFISGDAQIMMISLRSGAGLNDLQEVCSTIIFGELDWSPEVHTQLEGRLRRDRVNEGDEDNHVTAYYLTCDYGSDPGIIELLGVKADQARGIVDPHLEAVKVHTNKTRLKELAESYLKKV